MHGYHADNNGFPALYSTTAQPAANGPWVGATYACVNIPLLPYLEQAAITAVLPTSQATWPAGQQHPYATAIPSLVCPADAIPTPAVIATNPAATTWRGLTSYGVNIGTKIPPSQTLVPYPKDGMFNINTRRKIVEVIDGSSNTLLAGENSHSEPRWAQLGPTYTPANHFLTQSGVWWSSESVMRVAWVDVGINFRLPASLDSPPAPTLAVAANLINQRRTGYGSQHQGGANTAFADGSVRFLSDRISPITLQALATYAGDEVTQID